MGPTSFEFVVPEEAPITISPSVGTIQPGEVTRKKLNFVTSLLGVLARWSLYTSLQT